MTPETNEPTAAEWKVLAAVRAGGPMATRDVIEALAAEEWSDSTVKTLLRRLTEKGALKAKRIGNSFLYSATRAHWTALRRAGDTLLERAGDAATGPLLAHLVKQSRLSADELDELRALIDEKSEEGRS
ncbi:MAG: BlaI/MecI/CopY family transcriptional regulator [Planctomycetota bacterium]